MNKKYYNNGIEEKYFIIGQQPEGWVKGLTEQTKSLKKAKREATCLAKYGVKNIFQLDSVKEKCNTAEVIEKANISRLKTFKERYNVDNPSQLPQVKDKKRETCLKNNGVSCGFQTEACKQATTNPELIAQKVAAAKKTLIERYGVTNPYLIEEIYRKGHSIEAREKAKLTCENRTDEERLAIISKSLKGRSKYLYKNIRFDSSWELAFWIYCEDNSIIIEHEPIKLLYEFNNRKHYYIPDFRINNTQLVEIKSDYLLLQLKKEFTKDFAKYQCMLSNNVEILTLEDILYYLDYVYNKYGRNYLKQFKIRKKEK